MTEITEVRPAVFQSISIDQIRPAAHQARKTFDEESIKALADSMKEEGLLQPITVRQGGDDYELISGERRLRAAKLLGWTSIDAKIIQTVSEAEAAAKGMVENLQRVDLNPIEEAEGFKELNQLDPKYWDQPQIGKITGRSQEYVSLSLKLLGLPQTVLESIRRRILSRSHALELLRFSDPKQQEEAANQAVAKGLSQKETRQLVGYMLDKGKSTSHDPSAPPGSPAAFKFSKKGHGVSIAALYSGEGNFDDFLTSLRDAYGAWIAKNRQDLRADNAPKSDDALKADYASTVETAVPASSASQLSFRLPQNDTEHAELEALAVGSPSPQPVYAWIYGADNPMTKMMVGHSWSDFGVQDAKEGLKQLLDGLKLAKEQGL